MSTGAKEPCPQVPKSRVHRCQRAVSTGAKEPCPQVPKSRVHRCQRAVSTGAKEPCPQVPKSRVHRCQRAVSTGAKELCPQVPKSCVKLQQLLVQHWSLWSFPYPGNQYHGFSHHITPHRGTLFDIYFVYSSPNIELYLYICQTSIKCLTCLNHM